MEYRSLNISPEIYTLLKIYCAENGETVKKATETAIKKMIENERTKKS